jgi:hypothetical protein
MTRIPDDDHPDRADPPRALLGLMTGFWMTQALYVFAKLGLADLLGAGRRDVRDLAAACGVHEQSLGRLLRYLTAFGVVRWDSGDDGFALTPVGELLRGDSAGSMRSLALLYGGESYRAWGELLRSVQTGQPGFRPGPWRGTLRVPGGAPRQLPGLQRRHGGGVAFLWPDSERLRLLTLQNGR